MKAIRHFNFGAETPTKDIRARTRYKPRTAVLENCLSALELKALMKQQIDNQRPIQVPLNLGVATLHPSDQYNKKIGVQVASEKAKQSAYYDLTFYTNKEGDDENVNLFAIFRAVDVGQPKIFEIVLRLNGKSEYPEIENLHISENHNREVPW